MTIKYGKSLTWEKIKRGQAFYFWGCQGFGVKVSATDFMTLDEEGFSYGKTDFQVSGGHFRNGHNSLYHYHSIPLSLRKCLEAK